MKIWKIIAQVNQWTRVVEIDDSKPKEEQQRIVAFTLTKADAEAIARAMNEREQNKTPQYLKTAARAE